MNKDNAKDYLPLVQALAEGKEIQMLNCHDQWQDSVELELCYPASRYRVKPEPRRWWLVKANSDRYQSVAYTDPQSAAHLKTLYPDSEIIEVLEVLK